MKSLENISAKIILKKKREKSVLNRHPWIFSGAVDLIEGNFEPGDIVPVFANDGRFLAKGFLNPKSQIIVRILSFDDEPIDSSFFINRIQRAIALRKHYIDPRDTAYRLVHGEGDQLSGLVVDKYNDNLVMQIFSLGMDRLREDLLQWLVDLLDVTCIIERSEGESRKYEGLTPHKTVLRGKVPEKVVITENGLQYQVDLWNGQKTGFYLDQRNNRALVGKLVSENKRVLNCFSYSGGFSVSAAKNKAITASVDISLESIELAKGNFLLNDLDPSRHAFETISVFDYLSEVRETFDVIILDPPAFVKKKNHITKGSRAYKEINRLAMKRLSPGGLLLSSSCSSYVSWDLFQKILYGAAKDAGRLVRIIGRYGQPADHPVNIYHPEGEYLKSFLLTAD